MAFFTKKGTYLSTSQHHLNTSPYDPTTFPLHLTISPHYLTTSLYYSHLPFPTLSDKQRATKKPRTKQQHKKTCTIFVFTTQIFTIFLALWLSFPGFLVHTYALIVNERNLKLIKWEDFKLFLYHNFLRHFFNWVLDKK